jgi:hypothetical protein
MTNKSLELQRAILSNDRIALRIAQRNSVRARKRKIPPVKKQRLRGAAEMAREANEDICPVND